MNSTHNNTLANNYPANGNLANNNLGWGGTLRLALVQTALGAVVVLATSTLNRIMVVELRLPALLPAGLVAAHYLVQLLRLHVGYRVDVGGRCTPGIIAGMAILAAGGIAAAAAVVLMQTSLAWGAALAVLAYLAIGIGVGSAGTSNLALLTKRVAPQRRPLVAALVWIMMIAGFSCSAGLAGHFLQPFSPLRLLKVFSVACTLAFALAWMVVWRLEPRQLTAVMPAAANAATGGGFRTASRALWQDQRARRFTLFLFTAMFAFSAQELLLEPFAALVFGFTPAESARLAGLQNAGVLLGMVALVAAAIIRRQRTNRFAQRWMIGGTAGSALAIAVLAVIAAGSHAAALPGAAFGLGIANGTFAVSAVGVMMDLSAAGGRGREGIYMGLWGAAQAIAFATGGLTVGAVVDVSRQLLGSASSAYTVVLCLDALLFVIACSCALRLEVASRPAIPTLQLGPESGVPL